MTVVFKSDAIEAKPVYISKENALISETTNINSLKLKISNFVVSSKGELKGKGYDAIREYVMPAYDELLEERKKCSNELIKVIDLISSDWQSYMSPYEMLDTSELEGLKKDAKVLSDNLSALNNKIKKTAADYDLISSYSNSLAEINKVIELLEGVQPKDSDLKRSLDTVFESILSFKRNVDSLNSSIVGFNAVNTNDTI